MTGLIDKLQTIARQIDAAKPHLRFLGLVHPADTLNKWDLVISSDSLEPWSMESIRYVVARLQEKLTRPEMLQLARIVVLPRDHKVIADLTKDNPSPGQLHLMPQTDPFDRAITIWATKEAQVPNNGSRRRIAS